MTSAAVSASESLTGSPSVNCSSSLQSERAAVGALVVIEGEGGVLQRAEVAPDRTDSAVEFARGIIDRDADRVLDHLQELPLPSELVPARHWEIMTR